MNKRQCDRVLRFYLIPLLPSLVTGMTLYVLYMTLETMQMQVQSANRQFLHLNQGYLEIHPHVDPSLPDLDRVISVTGEQVINPNATFPSLNYYSVLKNIGNMPLRYNVEVYDVFINGEKYTLPFSPKDHTDGIIYPHQETTFNLKAVYLDKLQRKPIPYSDIQKLEQRNVIKITYYSTSDKSDLKSIERTLTWRFLGNAARFSWEAVEDKWQPSP